jgi:3-oxoadipate enol-lactonase
MSFVEVEGARLNYRFDGPDDAPILLLSNSLGTDLAMWTPQIAEFARARTQARNQPAALAEPQAA